MKLSVLCSSRQHPVWSKLERWVDQQCHAGHVARLMDNPADLSGGDILFLVSCSDIISHELRQQFCHVLVLHASDLPKGRGWSPYIWEVLNGAGQLTVTLLEAEDNVDSGKIWLKMPIRLQGHELLADILDQITEAELVLMSRAVTEAGTLKPVAQQEGDASYYPRRTPADSELDPDATLRDLFSLLRVVDNERFPAFFYLHGHQYRLTIEDLGPDHKPHNNTRDRRHE